MGQVPWRPPESWSRALRGEAGGAGLAHLGAEVALGHLTAPSSSCEEVIEDMEPGLFTVVKERGREMAGTTEQKRLRLGVRRNAFPMRMVMPWHGSHREVVQRGGL